MSLPLPINKRLHETVRLAHDVVDDQLAAAFPEVHHGDMPAEVVDQLRQTLLLYAFWWLQYNYPDDLVRDMILTNQDPQEH